MGLTAASSATCGCHRCRPLTSVAQSLRVLNGDRGCFGVEVTKAPLDCPQVQGPSKDNQAVTQARGTCEGRGRVDPGKWRPRFYPNFVSRSLHDGANHPLRPPSGPKNHSRPAALPGDPESHSRDRRERGWGLQAPKHDQAALRRTRLARPSRVSRGEEVSRQAGKFAGKEEISGEGRKLKIKSDIRA